MVRRARNRCESFASSKVVFDSFAIAREDEFMQIPKLNDHSHLLNWTK
jgi:hypothetical protein